jgi:hypothetical protein
MFYDAIVIERAIRRVGEDARIYPEPPKRQAWAPARLQKQDSDGMRLQAWPSAVVAAALTRPTRSATLPVRIGFASIDAGNRPFADGSLAAMARSSLMSGEADLFHTQGATPEIAITSRWRRLPIRLAIERHRIDAL